MALPSGFVPAHVTLDLSERNPVVQDYIDWAKSAGLSQEKFDEGLMRLVSAATSHLPDPAVEIAKLGEHGQQRVQRTVTWIKGAVSQQAYAALAAKGISADYIAALEELMQLAGEPKFAPDGAVPPTAVTRESVQQMMLDEKYWKTKDPRYIAEVEAAWKQVVGNGVVSTKSRPNTGGRAA